MKKGAKVPERVIFKRVIKKRIKRAGKKKKPSFKWVIAPKTPTVKLKPNLVERAKEKIKKLIGKE